MPWAAFPRRHNFLAMLNEMLWRKKMPGESLTKYYHSKLAMCERVGITGENVSSGIIGGLPVDMQATA